MTPNLSASLRETPPATLTAFVVSIAAHVGVLLWFGPGSLHAPQLAAFEPIEVALVSEPAPRQVLRSTLMRTISRRADIPATSESKAPQPETSTTEQARAVSSSQNEEPLVESRYDVRSLNNPKPPYPFAARRHGMEGKVVLRARVLEDGQCAEVKLMTSSGHDMLDSSALETVKRWRFVPASRGGAAVASWVEVPINFRLRNEPVALN